MTTRLSRRAAVAVGLSIVAIMLVWAPMGALADSGNGNAPTEAPGNSADAPGQADGTAPGNSENAPGQAETEAVTTTDAAPGNSGSAPGQTKTDSGPPETSNAGGNSGGSDASSSNGDGNPNAGGGNPNAGGGNPNAGGGNPNAGGANSDGGGSNPNSGDGGSANGDPATEGDCDQNDDGVGGAYDATCDGTHQNPGPGNSDNSPGKPADGTVGKADNKNPKGQQPGGNDHNKGYECEPGNTNKGVGKGNPAHTGCTTPPPCPVGSDNEVPPCVDPEEPDCNGDFNPNNNHTCESKVTVCHTTGNGGYVVISVSSSSWIDDDNNGHAGHAGDKEVAAGTLPSSCAIVVEYDCDSHALPNGHPATECDSVPQYDCDSHALPNGHSATECDSVPQYDCQSHLLPNDHLASECAGPQDQFDCAGHLLPNDHAATECDETDDPDDPDDPDDVLGTTLCPDGTALPPSGECEESVLPDFVLGIRLNQDPVAPAVLPNLLNAVPEGVAGAVLPFTGGSLLPFVMVSLATLSVGAASLIRRKK